MPHLHRLTAIIEGEDDGFVALCPEPDVASQGNTIEERAPISSTR
jgi:predicted RNase H-like HicB family nuclease